MDSLWAALEMTTHAAVFEARGVTKIYHVGEVEVHALRGADVDLYERAVLRPVKVGRRNELDAEILNGIKENEKVVIHPSDKTRDGIPLPEWRTPSAL
jgi:hypothetical protein